MNKKCPDCQLINFTDAENCRRCRRELSAETDQQANNAPPAKSRFLHRAAVCAAVCVLSVVGFYLSLIFSAQKLVYEERKTVEKAVALLAEKGFGDDVLLLEYVTTYRANDNWLNASVVKENAYAATNFPFEIMTIYPQFYTVPLDDTERAAILLHEAQHLKGADEQQAYEYVWKNRRQLGWTEEFYGNSVVWRNIRKQTKEYAPQLFVCSVNEYADCTAG